MAFGRTTPVIIGVGQCVDRENGGAGAAPSPLSLAIQASTSALADTGAADAVVGRLDRTYFVRTMLDSVQGVEHPFGRCANLPGTLAARLGVRTCRAIYSVVGGDQPQALVNEAAEAVYAGEAQAILIAGAEATAAMKAALKSRSVLDWSESVDGPMEDRGLGSELLSAYERTNGLGAPTQTYPIFEHALRGRLGLTRDDYLRLMSELWARFSEVAAGNPYAQFPQVRDAGFLATPSAENYPVSDPYLKWHVAQDAVNQGAAVILASLGFAEDLGIDPAKYIFLHGYSQVADRFVTERPDLSRSSAMSLALGRALESAGLTAQEIGHYDLYSCFPCAVLLAAEALGLNWREQPLTVTGGLPFFGGPGNNYSMHAIATMVERLRSRRDDYGLVLANGGFLSKEAVGIYSARPRDDWAPVSSKDLQQQVDNAPAPTLLSEAGECLVDSFTTTWKRGAPSRGYILGHTDKGRVLARIRSGHRATLAALNTGEPIGRAVTVVHETGSNFVVGPDLTSRRFEHVLVDRRGALLEVTLHRPDSMNALHSAAHFELHEIWDEFERDPDLWVAIVTGAGDRAFCSGNDLKVTAKGGDMSMPSSGFGGLCSRFDREKPIIAAVNGIAMGGGLEIALACDLIVADEGAKLALPEVKVGLFAAAGGVQRLTRQIGRKAAMEMILTGRAVGAGEAHKLGLINQIAPAGTALDAARDLAGALLANSPSAIRASRQALNKLDELERLQEAIAANAPIIGRLLRTKDFREGVSAFAEKRPPKWTNS